MTTAFSYELRTATAAHRRGFSATFAKSDTHNTVTLTRGATMLRIVTGPTRPGKEPVKAYALKSGAFVEVTFDDAIATILNFQRAA